MSSFKRLYLGNYVNTIGKASFKSLNVNQPEPLYPPTISSGKYDSSSSAHGFSIKDNPLNENRVVSYNVYYEDGTYMCNFLYIGSEMWVGECVNYGDIEVNVNVFVRAVDAYGNMSKPSNIVWANDCFVAGTPILMADNTYKMIEQVQVGDEVKSYNFKTKAYCKGTVSKVATGYTTRLAMVVFSEDKWVVMSEGHPLYTRDGWHSITNKNGYPTLVVGDEVLSGSKYIAIQDIQIIETEPTMVYSLGVTISNGEDMFDGIYFAGANMTIAASHGGGSGE